MFKNMKLGTKISVGFASLIVIAVALGGMATWCMLGVKQAATALAEQNVPEVGIGNDVERDSLSTMYATRGYAFTEEKQYLDTARKDLEEVKKGLKEAKDHAAKFDDAPLKQRAEKAEAKVLEYEGLLNDTVTRTEALNKDTDTLNVTAARYIKVCADYIDSQNKKLYEALKGQGAAANPVAAAATATADPAAKPAETHAGLNATEITDRVAKIAVANEIVDLGNAIRVGCWKAQTERDPKLFQEAQAKFTEVNKKLDDLKAVTKQDVNLRQIEDCRAAGKAYNDGMTSFLANWLAREELGKKRGATGNEVLELARTTSTSAMEEATKASTDAAASLSTASLTMIIGLSIGVVVGVLLAVFITRGITTALKRIIEGLNSGAEQTASAAGQVSSASQSLAEGASEQAAAIEETSSSIEEMSSMTKQNAGNAGEAKNLAATTRDSAAKGVEAMGKMSAAINDIKKSADKTAKIVKTIDEIAFQTNLLALNAAVEAARAGDAGKGFAVVAEEVRNLAQRSAEAAKNTANMIEESVKNAENGVAISAEVGKSLTEIAEVAGKVNDLVAEIAAASNEQSQGIDQVNTAVTQMDKVTQSNAANAEESASASEELSAQAEQLRGMVAELVAMVGGAKATATATVHQPNATHHDAGHHDLVHHDATAKTPAAAKKKALTHLVAHGGDGNGHGKAHSNPEDVIPMNSEKELSRF
jgi:methyl-accepting chemotaxis protein